MGKSPPVECHCGSGLIRRPLYDARGIFCNYVCDTCEEIKKKEFREDIFHDPNYWHDEPIDEDDERESD